MATDDAAAAKIAKTPVYLIDVDVLPCKTANKVIQGIKKAIATAGEKDGTAVVFLFKVVGENKVLSVVRGDPEPVSAALNDEVGDVVKFTCMVLRPYENFAHSVNKIDKEFCGPAPLNLTPGDDGHIYYCAAEFHFKGYTMEDLRKCWPKESQMMLENRKKGILQMEFWKQVATKTIHLFMVSDHDAADDMCFDVPLAIDLGDNFECPLKEVKFL